MGSREKGVMGGGLYEDSMNLPSLLLLWRINSYITVTFELPLRYSAYPIVMATESRLFFSKTIRGWCYHVQMKNPYYISNFSETYN